MKLPSENRIEAEPPRSVGGTIILAQLFLLLADRETPNATVSHTTLAPQHTQVRHKYYHCHCNAKLIVMQNTMLTPFLPNFLPLDFCVS